MSQTPILIKRYPNRRLYARNTSRYVSLEEIEHMIRAGETVEIRDSQTGEDLTRTILTQLIVERRPEKMALFPTEMLHCILRANDLTTEFLRSYFRDSLTYLEYLQKHAAPLPLAQPSHWMKAWWDSLGWGRLPGEAADREASHREASDAERRLAERIEQLEERLRQLEAGGEQGENGS